LAAMTGTACQNFELRPTKHVEDLARLANWLPDIAQSVSKLLQPAGVGGDIHVALNETPKLCLEVDNAVEFLVPELIVDGSPDGVRRGLGRAYDGANVLGHGVVQPTEDALVCHGPLRVTAVGDGGRREEVRSEPKLADESVKEAAPLGVVGLSEIELDGNVRLDAHRLQNCRRQRGDGGGWGVIDGGGRGGGTTGVREIDTKQGVVSMSMAWRDRTDSERRRA